MGKFGNNTWLEPGFLSEIWTPKSPCLAERGWVMDGTVVLYLDYCGNFFLLFFFFLIIFFSPPLKNFFFFFFH